MKVRVYTSGRGKVCRCLQWNLEIWYTKTKCCWPCSLIAGVIYRKLHIFYTAVKVFSWWAIQFVPLPWNFSFSFIMGENWQQKAPQFTMHDCDVMICSLPIVFKLNMSALNVRFGVLMSVTVKIFILWDMMSCSVVKCISISEECVANSSTMKLK